MSLLEWNTTLNIDVNDIDERMKRLFESINQYLKYDSYGSKPKGGDDEIGEALEGISEAIRQHFAYEEWLLTRYRYPDIAEHRKEHRRFMKKVLAFRRVYSEEPEKIYSDSVKYMREWLVKHIQDVDMRYAPFVRVQKYLEMQK